MENKLREEIKAIFFNYSDIDQHDRSRLAFTRAKMGDMFDELETLINEHYVRKEKNRAELAEEEGHELAKELRKLKTNTDKEGE